MHSDLGVCYGESAQVKCVYCGKYMDIRYLTCTVILVCAMVSQHKLCEDVCLCACMHMCASLFL